MALGSWEPRVTGSPTYHAWIDAVGCGDPEQGASWWSCWPKSDVVGLSASWQLDHRHRMSCADVVVIPSPAARFWVFDGIAVISLARSGLEPSVSVFRSWDARLTNTNGPFSESPPPVFLALEAAAYDSHGTPGQAPWGLFRHRWH